MPEVGHGIAQRHRDMPYRCLLHWAAARPGHTGGWASMPIFRCGFYCDICAIETSLLANKGKHAGLFGVQRLPLRTHFCFHL
jgi:hypothetical protein